MAFLVCTSSTDPYIQYSGYLSMLEYVASAFYSADKELYTAALSLLDEGARGDIRASNEITRAHMDSWIRKLSDSINDTYLKANGTEGVVSYGYVVRLAVGYIQNLNN